MTYITAAHNAAVEAMNEVARQTTLVSLAFELGDNSALHRHQVSLAIWQERYQVASDLWAELLLTEMEKAHDEQRTA